MKKFLILIFIYTVVSKLIAQDLTFEHITAENGLSQSSVICIAQDSLGFMWFGTPNGLNRYDGYDIKIYKHDVNNVYSIGENRILSLLTDSRNILWICTLNGLNIYDHKTNRFYKIDIKSGIVNSGSKIRISTIFEAKDGTIWVGTGDLGLIKIILPKNLYNLSDNLAIHYIESYSEGNNNYTINNITDICQNKDGNLWITTRSGIIVFDPEREKVVKTYNNESNNSYSLSSLINKNTGKN